jgi:2-polyprenyl-3-methyl-5-hydroxy-6-metoxy-1,4-benzoquinol methylase
MNSDLEVGAVALETRQIPVLPWTGERCVPEAMSIQASRVLTEHLARYWWAAERILELESNRVVLDAPSGAGYGTAILAAPRNVAITMGVDIDPAAIEYARDRYGMPGRIIFGVSDLTAVRTRADVVVSFEGIEHVVNQEAAAQALCAALKPGGLLFVSTPRCGGPGAGSPFHTRELNLEEFVALFSSHVDVVALHGQNIGVGDAPLETARYFVLEGRKRTP